MLPSLLVAWACESAIYFFFIIRADRGDWANLAIVLVVLLAANIFAALMLAASKMQDSPLATAGLITSIAFVVGVAALSAFRVPISYVALGICSLIACGGLAFANIRLQNSSNRRVALLWFNGAEEVRGKFPFDLPFIAEVKQVKDYDLVLIDTESMRSPEDLAVISKMYVWGVEIYPWSHYLERISGRVRIRDFDLSDLVFRPGQIYYSIAKRTLDVVSVTFLLPIATPIAALIWLYVRWLDGGPSLFIQQRRGRLGKSFRMYKFRTMRKGGEGGATQEADLRILPGCNILRQLRLDELPQLLNILRGDMSWIGPRPVSLEIAEELERRIPQYINRQVVLPGLTGWAQVKFGYASSLEEEVEKLSFDLFYVKHLSFDLDLLILFKTVKTVLWRVGAR